MKWIKVFIKRHRIVKHAVQGWKVLETNRHRDKTKLILADMQESYFVGYNVRKQLQIS